jgi:O-antigen/teichoic acid export membrane protein
MLEAADAAVPGAVIGGMLGPEALGYYNLASRLLAQSSGILLGPLHAVTLPVAASAQSDPAMLKHVLQQGLRLSTAISYPVFIGAAIITPIFVPLFFGSAWTDMIPTVQLMMLVGVRSATASFTGGVIRGAGRPASQAGIVVFGLVLSIISLPLVARFGLPAVVAAVLAKGIATWLVGAFVLQHMIGYSVQAQLTVGWPSMAACIVMWGAVAGALGVLHGLANPWVTLFLAVALGALAYSAALVCIAPGFGSQLARLLQKRLRASPA